MQRAWLLALSTLSLVWIPGCGDECAGISCDACLPTLTLLVESAPERPPTIDGNPCVSVFGEGPTSGGRHRCELYLSPGPYAVLVDARGFVPQEVEGNVLSGGPGCCACDTASPAERSVTLVPEG